MFNPTLDSWFLDTIEAHTIIPLLPFFAGDCPSLGGSATRIKLYYRHIPFAFEVRILEGGEREVISNYVVFWRRP